MCNATKMAIDVVTIMMKLDEAMEAIENEVEAVDAIEVVLRTVHGANATVIVAIVEVIAIHHPIEIVGKCNIYEEFNSL